MTSIKELISGVFPRLGGKAGLLLVGVGSMAMLAFPQVKENNLLAESCPNPQANAVMNVWPITYSAPAELCHDYQPIDARIVNGGTYSRSAAQYQAGLTAKEGDEIYVLQYLHNGAANVGVTDNRNVARNITDHVTVPTNVGTDHTLSASFGGTNTNTINGSYTIHTDSNMALQAVPNSAEMYNYQGTTLIRSGFDVTSTTYLVGDMNACFEHSVFIRFKVKVVKVSTPVTPTPPVVNQPQPIIINNTNINQNNNQNTLQNINQNGNGNSAAASDSSASGQAANPVTNTGNGQQCAQVITRAFNPATGEVRDFSTPCQVPAGWLIGAPVVTTTTGSTTVNSGSTNQNNNQNGLSNINQNGNGNSASTSIAQASAQAAGGSAAAAAAAVAVSSAGSTSTTSTFAACGKDLQCSKSAWNDSKGVDAQSVSAAREDFITYTLKVSNIGSTAQNNFVITDDLSGVLPFADITDNGGATVNGNTISFAAVNIPANGSVSKTFRVRVKYFLNANLTYVMTNTFGNTVTINIGSSGVTYVAPKTGAAGESAVAFASLLTLGAAGFLKRKALMSLIFA